jgi:hypothetical protein
MSITISKLIAFADANFRAAKALSESSKPGCRDARKRMKRAAKYGLDDKAYMVGRQGGYINMIGWGARGIEILRCVREGGAA